MCCYPACIYYLQLLRPLRRNLSSLDFLLPSRFHGRVQWPVSQCSDSVVLALVHRCFACLKGQLDHFNSFVIPIELSLLIFSAWLSCHSCVDILGVVKGVKRPLLITLNCGREYNFVGNKSRRWAVDMLILNAESRLDLTDAYISWPCFISLILIPLSTEPIDRKCIVKKYCIHPHYVDDC